MDDISRSYQALGLQEGAPFTEIKQAYRDLVRVWHPDRFQHDERLRQIAQDKLKDINGAYKVLEAHFFENDRHEEAAPPTDTSPEAEEPPSPEPALAGGRRAVLAVALGVAMLALLAAVVMVALKWDVHEATDARPPGLPGEATGPIRHALSFDGASGRLTIATTGSLTGAFTVECWVLTRRPKGTETIVSSRGPKDCAFDIKFREGKRFHADIGDGSRWLMKMANATFRYNPNIWYHLAYVVTPTNYTVYVNGDYWCDSLIYPPGQPMLYDEEHQLMFGADSIDSDPLNGCIADVRVWNTARTADEIKTNMSRVLTGHEAGLNGWWRFDEDQGVTVADSSSRGYAGTLVGNVTRTTKVPPAFEE